MNPFQNLTILYIETDFQCQEKNTALMRELGLKVLEAQSTEETNELFRHNKIDLILIDLNLHQKERMNFLRFLRYKDIVAPIIITSDDSDKDILLDAINLDTTRFLIKPLKKDELLNALKIAVNKLLPPLPPLLVNNDLGEGFSYDPINKSVVNPNDETIHLTKKEYLFLELLLKNKHRILLYEEIENILWQESSMSVEALRTLVRSIRKKTYPKIVTNHSAIGYIMDQK